MLVNYHCYINDVHSNYSETLEGLLSFQKHYVFPQQESYVPHTGGTDENLKSSFPFCLYNFERLIEKGD